MPGIVNQPHLDSDSHVNLTFSLDTFCHMLPIVRYYDARVPEFHFDFEHICAWDCGITIDGADIIVNNRHIQYIGHPTTSGSIQCQGCGIVIGN